MIDIPRSVSTDLKTRYADFTKVARRMEKPTVRKQGNALRTYRYTLLNRKAEILVALGIDFRELRESEREAGADPARTSIDPRHDFREGNDMST